MSKRQLVDVAAVAAEPFEAVLAKRAEALEAVFAARDACKEQLTGSGADGGAAAMINGTYALADPAESGWEEGEPNIYKKTVGRTEDGESIWIFATR